PSVRLLLANYLLITLQCPPTFPDPPSFPTRRSSDLRHGQPGPDAQTGTGNEQALAPRRPLGCPVQTASAERAGRGPARPLAGSADRKSTRLNSSHQIISYAVFCLKKKTDTQKRTSYI